MMYDLITRKPELVLEPKGTMSLRSNKKIQFEEEHINYEIYGKSPYIIGNRLWKQLAHDIQNATSKVEFDRVLTDDIIQHLKN